MLNQSPALTSNLKFKDVLFPQNRIVRMIKKNSFKSARQLIPHREIQATVDKLELDKKVQKLHFLKLFKAIFYSTVVKNNGFSRSIASVGQTRLGHKFTGLNAVSHVAIINRLNAYDEEKLDAMLSQINRGCNSATLRNSQVTAKLYVIDGTTFTFPMSRVKDQLPKSGRKLGATKGMMKMGLTINPGNMVPFDWQFSTDYDDNQIFRDLTDWTKTGYTYVIDRGNTAVDYLKKFTDHGMYFIQKTYEGHTFDKLWSKRLPRTTRVLRRYDLLEEQRGYLLQKKSGIKVKVRRLIMIDERNNEKVSITTNNLESPNHVIVKQHDQRWNIEVVNDWVKNTLGPNTDHKLTQWKRLRGLRNLIRIWLTIIGLLVSYAKMRFGINWRKPQRFSLGDVVCAYAVQLERWLEGKLGLRRRQYDSKVSRD